MVVHVVLYRPRPNLEGEVRSALLAAIGTARHDIPQIQRFLVGTRLVNGPQYKLAHFPDFPYVALVEFADRAGLEAYLAHPGHEPLGRIFNETVEAGLVYDYEVADVPASASEVNGVS